MQIFWWCPNVMQLASQWQVKSVGTVQEKTWGKIHSVKWKEDSIKESSGTLPPSSGLPSTKNTSWIYCCESSVVSQGWLGDWSLSPWGETWRTGTVQPRKKFREILSPGINTCWESRKERGPDSSHWSPVIAQNGTGTNWSTGNFIWP